MSQSDTTWLLQSLAFFRKLHFYQQFSYLSDEALAWELLYRWQEMFGAALDLSRPYAELELLIWDTQRVWWEDLEADVCAGNDIYIQTIEQWQTISRGAFQPTTIIEHWASLTGPIRIAFEHQGQHHLLYPQYLDDYIDIDILCPINRMIQQSGIQFTVYHRFDQSAFVVALKAEEKEALATSRGWKFAQLVNAT